MNGSFLTVQMTSSQMISGSGSRWLLRNSGTLSQSITEADLGISDVFYLRTIWKNSFEKLLHPNISIATEVCLPMGCVAWFKTNEWKKSNWRDLHPQFCLQSSIAGGLPLILAGWQSSAQDVHCVIAYNSSTHNCTLRWKMAILHVLAPYGGLQAIYAVILGSLQWYSRPQKPMASLLSTAQLCQQVSCLTKLGVGR